MHKRRHKTKGGFQDQKSKLMLLPNTQISPLAEGEGGFEAQAWSLDEEPSAYRSEEGQHKGDRKNVRKEKINNLKVFRLVRVYVIINSPSPAPCSNCRGNIE